MHCTGLAVTVQQQQINTESFFWSEYHPESAAALRPRIDLPSYRRTKEKWVSETVLLQGLTAGFNT